MPKPIKFRVLEAIKAKLIENPLGFSINSNLKTNPSFGYMVGGEVPSVTLTKSLLEHEVSQFVDTNKDKKGKFFGIWTDSETELIHLDINTHTQSKTEAISLGLEREEIAIWDCRNNCEVRLK